MRVDAANVMQLLLKHQPFFFRLIAEMDKHNGTLPLSFYQQQFHQELKTLPEPTERQRWRNAMLPENLDQAGLLLQLNEQYGTMKWQNFVVEMFRHFNKSLLRPLSDKHLRSFQQQLANILPELTACQRDVLQSDYGRDLLALLFDTLNLIHSRIRENTESLAYKVAHFAELIEHLDVADWAQTQRTQHAFSEVRKLYDQVVLPTLSFLNQNEPSLKGEAALQLMDNIAHHLLAVEMPNVAQRVLQIKSSISGFAKEIELICRQMVRYIQQSEREQRKYDALEKAFNRLRGEVEKRYDSKLNKSRLSLSALTDNPFPALLHLKRRYIEPRLNWAESQQAALFEEYLRVTLTQRAEQIAPKPIIVEQNEEQSLRAQQQILRAKRLQQAVEQFSLENISTDIQISLHHYLQQHLPEYQLPDLIDALTWLKLRQTTTFTPIYGLKRLAYGAYCLYYHPLYPDFCEETSNEQPT